MQYKESAHLIKELIRRYSAQQIKEKGRRRKDAEEGSGEEVWQIGAVFFYIRSSEIVATR